MKIIIIGGGKVGITLAEHLSTEDHEVTVIDKDQQRLDETVDKLDVLGIAGNGATVPILKKAGAETADLVIAVTEADELNLLACLIARRIGARYAIARVRNPEYSDMISLIKDDMGLSLAINPELGCASEIARVLRFPKMIDIDTFAKGKVELLQFMLPDDSPLIGLKLREMGSFTKDCSILICAVERNDQVHIPSGEFTIEKGDKLSIICDPSSQMNFFSRIGMLPDRIRSIMIVGGGRIAYYLAKQIIPMGISVKIIEDKYNRCLQLSELLPDADIIYGDGSDQQILIDEGVESMDAFAALTGIDEENIMLSLHVGSLSNAKLITKITRNPFTSVISNLNLGSVFYPRTIAAEHILSYVRALQNSYGSNVETLYKIIDNKAEALEFYVTEDCRLAKIPLAELKTKKNLLIGSINRAGSIIIPSGSDMILPGDTVVVITTHQGLNKLEEILD
ncbi:MAG: Trk system potassium transporter TrkA [Anaerovoracaceae bacterium]